MIPRRLSFRPCVREPRQSVAPPAAKSASWICAQHVQAESLRHEPNIRFQASYASERISAAQDRHYPLLHLSDRCCRSRVGGRSVSRLARATRPPVGSVVARTRHRKTPHVEHPLESHTPGTGAAANSIQLSPKTVGV